MQNTATDMNMMINKSEKAQYSNRIVWICAFLTVLIFARAVSNVFFYAFVAVSGVLFVVSNVKKCTIYLFFLLPFANILKTNAEGMSFFTILFFLTVVKFILATKKFSLKVILSIIVLFGYTLLISGIGQLTSAITMVVGMFLIYLIRSVDIDVEKVIYAFAFGICLASILALFKDALPIIDEFVRSSSIKTGQETYVARFAGLHGNPNYFTMDITVVLSAILVLMKERRQKLLYVILFIALSVFGLMSVSKSFLLSWAVLILFWFIISLRQGVGKLIKFIMVAILGVAVIYFVAYDYINTYLFRLVRDSTGTLDSITTGRTEIWRAYFDEILSNAKILFVGNGINTVASSIEKGAHNTFIESIFYYGIIGTAMFIFALRTCVGKIITKKIMWVPVIILLLRMIAIGILTWDNLWYYLMIFVLLSKECKKGVNKGELNG